MVKNIQGTMSDGCEVCDESSGGAGHSSILHVIVRVVS